MAYNLDTHRFLHFNLTHNPTGDPDEDFHYLDIGKMLSECNRRAYRQGMSYDVANVVFHDSDASETFIKVCTAPNTWAVQAAWRAGFRHWRQQIDIAEKSLEDDDALTGPWSDFKVYINDDHRTDGDKAIFVDCEDNTLDVGNWDYSQYTVTTDSGTYDNVAIGLMGPHNGDFTAGAGVLVSLLEVLENTINTPQEDPDIAAGAVDSLWAFLNPDMSAHPDTVQQVIARGRRRTISLPIILQLFRVLGHPVRVVQVILGSLESAASPVEALTWLLWVVLPLLVAWWFSRLCKPLMEIRSGLP